MLSPSVIVSYALIFRLACAIDARSIYQWVSALRRPRMVGAMCSVSDLRPYPHPQPQPRARVHHRHPPPQLPRHAPRLDRRLRVPASASGKQPRGQLHRERRSERVFSLAARGVAPRVLVSHARPCVRSASVANPTAAHHSYQSDGGWFCHLSSPTGDRWHGHNPRCTRYL